MALGSTQLQKSAPQENYFKFLLTVSNCEECLFMFLVPTFLNFFFCVIVVRIATFNPKVQRWISILLHSTSFYLRNNSNSPSFFSWQKNVIFAQLPLRKPRTFNFCGGRGVLNQLSPSFPGRKRLATFSRQMGPNSLGKCGGWRKWTQNMVPWGKWT